MWILRTLVNREALLQVLKMYDVGDKLLNGIRSIHVNSLAYVRAKGGESKCFRITSGVRQGCIMSTWLFNVYMDAVMKMKMGMRRKGVKFQEEGREWRLPDLLYTDDLVLGRESEEELRAMAGRFVKVCMRRGLKVIAAKSKMMVLVGEEGLECEVCVYGIRLEHVLEFK